MSSIHPLTTQASVLGMFKKQVKIGTGNLFFFWFFCGFKSGKTEKWQKLTSFSYFQTPISCQNYLDTMENYIYSVRVGQ